MQEVRIKALVTEPRRNLPVLLLQGIGLEKVVPIWMGHAEANAIALVLEGEELPRPLTWDLLKNVIQLLGGELDKVAIDGIHDGAYYATLFIQDRVGEVHKVDARPSDSVALALRTDSPIYISEKIFEANAIDIWQGTEPGSFYF